MRVDTVFSLLCGDFCVASNFVSVPSNLGGTLATGSLLLQGESTHPSESDRIGIRNKQVRASTHSFRTSLNTSMHFLLYCYRYK